MPPADQLNLIVEKTRALVAEQRAESDLGVLRDAATQRRETGGYRPFLDALQEPGLSVIAEHKRRSPSADSIEESIPLEDVVIAYERAGAAALSILTEPNYFGGHLNDLQRARVASSLPILRKDFIVDEFQILQAAACGADAVLLIVAALGDELAELQECAAHWGLTAMVEVHDRNDLDVASRAGATLIDINNRNLGSLAVDQRRTFDLLAEVPEGTTVVAASGFSERHQLEELAHSGVAAVLIGEALMRRVKTGTVAELIHPARQFA